jgi:hypothetical protein
VNSIQIQNWALEIIDCVQNGQPSEDFLVELKAAWPPVNDHNKIARRIAGHANAARGEKILWLIGVDEKNKTVNGADTSIDLSSWYPQIQSHFNELAPSVTPVNIPVDGVTVVALLFETDRAPFVVKNKDYGTSGVAVELEVPWRENTSIRSARRADLIRLLAPLELLPEIQILDSISLAATIAGDDSRTGNYYSDELCLTAEMYIIPKSKNRIVIPFHQCKVEFKVSGTVSILEAESIRLYPAIGNYSPFITTPGSLTIQSTSHELIVDDLGRFSLRAIAKRPDVEKDVDILVSIYLWPAGAERPVVLTKTLPYPEAKPPSSY